ncbi:hypothetical protein CKN96_12415 [Carnobacterium maltaromaticum]|nr:polysaccharide biosynthesis C-terminal domain-containing protein [Carnobacterium maltaromaticum]TFJ55402.1 hypothetical protein CKN96_12415 [Carnobacterium maltaromaticum]
MTTSDYGMVDILTTTVNMLLPIISLSVFDAVLRFTMDRETDNKKVFTNAVLITFVGSLIVIFSYPLILKLNIFPSNLPYLYSILILQSYQSLFAQYIRATGKIKIYAANGILTAIITAIVNVFLLVFLNLGIKGYLISMIIATLASVLFLVLNIQITKCFALSKIDTEVIKKLLTFSIPLMPNAMMWWVVNASNRYFILFFIGTSVNGLFAVANKIPSLLSIIQSIFFQAWQMSAIEEFDSGDKSKFYSNIFEIFSVIMIIGTSFILVILKRIMYYLVAPNFFSSWELVPFLLMGILFSSFSSFLGTNYIAAKKTKGVLKTSLVGAIVNVVCCFIFIPWIGANGAGIATMISFFSIWIIRYFDTKKFIKMEINFKKLLINSTIIFTQIFILYNTTINKFETFFEIALFVLLIFMNREVFCIIVNKITKK